MRKKPLKAAFISHEWILTVIIGGCLMAGAGCSDVQKEEGTENLITCDDRVVTVSDYNKVLAVAKASYSFEMIQDKKAFKAIKITILNQLIEEMVLLRMAEENKISVSDEELTAAIDVIREDYPEEEFKKALLENVVSYEVWEKRLKKRILMEKVVKTVLDPQVTVTDEEVTRYLKTMENKGKTGEDQTARKPDRPDNDQIVMELRRKKMEETYKNFIMEYRDKYKIEIDDAQWSKIIGD